MLNQRVQLVEVAFWVTLMLFDKVFNLAFSGLFQIRHFHLPFLNLALHGVDLR